MDCTPKMVMCVVTEFPGTVSNSTVQSQLFHVYQIICVEIETFMPIMLYVRAQRERLGTGAIQSCAVQEHELWWKFEQHSDVNNGCEKCV